MIETVGGYRSDWLKCAISLLAGEEVATMPRRHEVNFTVPEIPLGNAAVIFEVKVDGEYLAAYREGLECKPASAQHRRRLSLQQLPGLALAHGRRVPNCFGGSCKQIQHDHGRDTNRAALHLLLRRQVDRQSIVGIAH